MGRQEEQRNLNYSDSGKKIHYGGKMTITIKMITESNF
jgi:hypothetical protein